MASRHNTISVGTSATALEGTQFPGWVLQNPTGGQVVYIGDSDVTTATGFPIAVGTEFRPEEISYRQLTGKDSERLYGIVAATTQDVHVLVPGRVVR